MESAMQATPDLERGKALYYNCAICHTPEGWAMPSGAYPQIAGQHKSVLMKQLADIALGNRDNPTMVPFATPLFEEGPQALADVAAYIEKLPMAPFNGIGSGMYLPQGEKLYKDNCAKCHGANAEGHAKEFQPRLQGQHFLYLLRQLQWIQSGKRRNADKKMVEQIRGMTPTDLEALADYISRLRPDKEHLAKDMNWRNPDFQPSFTTGGRPGQ
ncbi:putative cytochrome c553 [Magnetofaba australis IT-1]|uniref:Putative cytochrome c553 n=1 Tax=Magnetofaba australis IT-1 TaxID=1434232 RepID=A0A1Y2K8M6_9PROT|nr:putative cytochrome c553 [Magnetofaba australis IT-1]